MERPTDPAKLKARIAYNSASDHFDDEPLAFWTRAGSRIVERLALPPGATVLDVGCGGDRVIMWVSSAERILAAYHEAGGGDNCDPTLR